MKSPQRVIIGCFVMLICAVSSAASHAADSPTSVSVDWLGKSPPLVNQGVSWGIPWPMGKIRTADHLVLTGADGKSIPVQSWPMAFWPDGSLKWTGQAIAADAVAMNRASGPMQISVGEAAAAQTVIQCTSDETGIDIDTGACMPDFEVRGESF